MEVIVLIAVIILVAMLFGAASGNQSPKGFGASLAKIPDFAPAVSEVCGKRGYGLAIDTTNNKLAITHKKELSVFSFTDIIAVEVCKNGETVTNTNRGSQVVGAAVGMTRARRARIPGVWTAADTQLLHLQQRGMFALGDVPAHHRWA